MTAKLISKERVSYMEAWIKTYSDGTKILQSYETDVVKMTPEGKYIRLWHDWSVSTNRQVYRAFNVSLKSLPFEDGTVEQPCVYRKGLRFNSWTCMPVSDRIEIRDNEGKKTKIVEQLVDSFDKALKSKDITDIKNAYSTCIDKELREKYKDNEKMFQLFRAMRVCLEQKPRQDEISMLCKIYEYDFGTVYSYIKQDYDFLGDLQC